MLRRTKLEVEQELPSKVEHVVRCDMSAWQRIWYRQITEKVGPPPAMYPLQALFLVAADLWKGTAGTGNGKCCK